jgi:hypothetical protein
MAIQYSIQRHVYWLLYLSARSDKAAVPAGQVGTFESLSFKVIQELIGS